MMVALVDNSRCAVAERGTTSPPEYEECEACGHPAWHPETIATGVCRACARVARTGAASTTATPPTPTEETTVVRHCPNCATMYRVNSCYPNCEATL